MSLKNKFIQAVTHKPRETGLIASPIAAWIGALAILPFDAGASLFAFSAGTFLSSGFVRNSPLPSSKDVTILTHNNQKFQMARSQYNAIQKALNKITSAKKAFKETSDPKQRARLEKKAQKAADYIDLILDSKNIRLVSDIENDTAEFTVNFKPRGPGN